MSKETRELILGWALIGFSSIGVYTVCKEMKDAYYKHRILKHGKEVEELGNRVAKLYEDVLKAKEEESQ